MSVCQFLATGIGAADFVVASAVAGHKTPIQAGAINGNSYEYHAWFANQYEYGIGLWVSGTTTLQRTVVQDNSDSTLTKIVFLGVPTVDVYPSPAPGLELSPLGHNILVNGDFRINQRVYVSAAALAAGVYGHDHWKAGSAGGDYSFTQLKSSTQITIAASKTLIQVVEDVNVVGGNYVLSWSGTCQARVGLNSAIPSGSYANSPILITGQTAGTVMSIEFGNGTSTGTLGAAQLEVGTTATSFEFTSFATEFVRCQRYYEKSYDYATAPGTATSTGMVGGAASGSAAANIGITIIFAVQKRATPTMSMWSGGGTANQFSTGLGATTNSVVQTAVQNTGLHSFAFCNSSTGSPEVWAHFTADAEL